MPPTPPDAGKAAPLTYKATGVDTEAGDRAVELMRQAVSRTHGPEVVGGLGGFAGLFDASALRGYNRPLLASSTDGVGTKLAIAQAMDRHDTVGIDLVAMVVDDLVVCGAKPLAMTDYIACGKVVPERIAAIVAGVAAGCEGTGTALVGGETAEHPGVMADDEYDLAGAAFGVVEGEDLLGPDRVRVGDAVIGMTSNGIHTNGFSLVRGILKRSGWGLDRLVPELGTPLGEALLTPTRLYANTCLRLAADLGPAMRAFAHVTGGGLAANLARAVPPWADALIRRDTWTVPRIFPALTRLGDVAWQDAERTWNLGIGMVAIVAGEAADAAMTALAGAGQDACLLGRIVEPRIGSVAAEDAAPGDVVQGTKAVSGGRVVLRGAYRW
jgi:phosphoribosylformylglycinamidine cyclo-ligase